jgi:isoleucyl-tRNA synthetase
MEVIDKLNRLIEKENDNLSDSEQKERFPILETVKLNGTMCSGEGMVGEGKFVKDADKDIIADLKGRNLLWKEEKIHHDYPFCWRCKTPLLYYARQTWYIRTSQYKEQLVALNKRINWVPGHIREGRFGNWLENNVDWAFSRERYWGTPLPVWRCESCGAYECVGGIEELEKKPGFSGFKEPLDLHRPFIDEVTFNCPKCGGKIFCEPVPNDGGRYSYDHGFDLRCINGHRFQGYQVIGTKKPKFCIVDRKGVK